MSDTITRTVGDMRPTVTRGGQDWERRTVYRYVVECDGREHSGSDLRTGVRSDDGPAAMLGALLSFLFAAVESGEAGENGDLFPAWVREAAERHSDELAMLAIELEEA